MSFFKIFFCIVFLSAIRLCGQINPTVSSSTGNYSLTCANSVLTLSASSSFIGPVSYTWTNPQLIVANGSTINATAPGTFSLSASSGTILQTITVSVVINTVQPTLSLTAVSNSITCSTPTILMTTVSNPTNVSYAWVEPGVGFGCTSSTCIAAQTGTYSVTVKDAVNGCQKTATLNIVDNRQYPIFSSIGQYTVACPNGTVSLEPTLTTGTTNISFQWKIPPGAVTSPTNNLSLITNAPGEYTLISTNSMNGCATSTLVNVLACVGLNENFQKLKIIGYPNPASTVFNLEMEQGIDFIVQVADVYSRNLFSLSNEKQINFAQLKPGLYFVTVQSSKGTKIFKVIKQ